MGGRTFAEPTARVGRALHDAIVATYTRALLAAYPGALTHVPRSAPGKSDFGDVDILMHLPSAPTGKVADHLRVLPDTLRPHLPQGAIAEFKATPLEVHLVHDARAGSTDPDAPSRVQVDLIPLPSTTEFAFACDWFDDGDKSSVLGQILRPFGFKLTQTGFVLRANAPGGPQSGQRPREFVLTTDYLAVLDFAGLDRAVHAAGFATPRDLAEWLRRCRFFSPAAFLASLPKTGEQSRRMAIRPRYVELITILAEGATAELGDTPASPPPERVSPEEVSKVVDEALDYFGQRGALEAWLAELAANKPVKDRIDGTRIMAVTGLTNGPGVGQMLRATRRVQAAKDAEYAALHDPDATDAAVDAALSALAATVLKL
ncbi:hypothetical protein H9P43_004684 [Blastocladiella emersonii ATCC 22665]|nr:hypothetical protein H9P43_004684 [Blastocladiella emersonii ATCC 22665]